VKQSKNRRRAAAVAVVCLLGLTACSGTSQEKVDDQGPATQAASGTEAAVTTKEVKVITHDSFVVTDELKAAFQAETGYELTLLPASDVGSMVNQLILTKDAPLGDAVVGIDNAFASRALDADTLEAYSSPAWGAEQQRNAADDSGRLTAVDFSDVCVNIDLRAVPAADYPPASFGLDLLADPAFKDQLVVENPATSSPGAAFLLATVAAYGEDGWLDYWQQLVDNGVKVTSDWETAYYSEFSGPSSDGTRALVVSYASSPPSEIEDGHTEPSTAAALGTCYRQVEYAGVLKGAANPEGAQAFIDFLLSDQFQASVPGEMWVFPIKDTAALPDDWAAFAPLTDQPWVVPSAQIAEKLDGWITQWTNLVLK
jgi:thiamine transport system substrate-binding protein